MSTSTTLTSVLSALGGSNGIDVTSAVNTILYADRAQERSWQAQQTTLSAQAAALTQIQSESSSLTDALSALQTSNGVLTAVSATTSNSSILTATAAYGTPASSHLIEVKSLAKTASWYSAAEDSASTALTAGSFSITAGGVTKSITINSGDTLASLAASINSQSLGLTANVVTDSSGARLALVSTASGTAGDFAISNPSGLAFTRANTGTDASLSVDGVPVTSATNTVTGAISGVTLNLLGSAVGSEISLNLSADTTSITSAVSAFVTAYNTLIKDVNSQFVFDKSTDTAGTLSGDSTIFNLQSDLLSSTNFKGSTGTLQSLTQLGITTQRDGTLSLDSTAFASALAANSTAVATFFQGAARDGFVSSLNTTLNKYSDPTQGAFTTDLKSLTNEFNDLTDRTNTLEIYLTAKQKTLTTQYNNIDIALQQLPQKLKQIQALLNPNSDSSSS